MERTVPFGLICSAWSPSGTRCTVTPRRSDRSPGSSPLVRHETEPSYDDMAVKLRRVIIAARFRSPYPEQATPKKPPSSQPGPPPGLDQQKLRNTRDVPGARTGHRAMPDSLIAAGFARRGVAGLIAWPSAEPVFDAALLSAHVRRDVDAGETGPGTGTTPAAPKPSPTPAPGGASRQVPRPREDWIAIAVPAIIDEQTFEAAGRVSRQQPVEPAPGRTRRMAAAWPGNGNLPGRRELPQETRPRRRLEPLLPPPLPQPRPDQSRRGRPALPRTQHPFDALDDFVFDQVRAALLRPDVLTAGEQALAVRTRRPRRRTARRRTGPPGPQARRRRCRTPPPHRPLPSRSCRATRAATPCHPGRAPPPRPGPTS